MNKIKTVLSHVFLSFLSLFSIFPLYWMFVSATNTSVDVVNGRLLPGKALLDNLADVMAQLNLWQCLGNSLFIAALVTFFSLLISSLAGYAFVIYRDKYKMRALKIVLAGMMIPGIATMIPLYKMVSTLKLVNTPWACIIPSLTSIMMIFLFRQGTQRFPREVIQAARVDGLSEIGIFFRIYFPMMKSTYATAFILTFMGSWNSYMWPRLVLMKKARVTVPILINNLLNGYTPNYGAVMLGCSMCTLPMLIIFLCMQKAFAEGIAGSVKG